MKIKTAIQKLRRNLHKSYLKRQANSIITYRILWSEEHKTFYPIIEEDTDEFFYIRLYDPIQSNEIKKYVKYNEDMLVDDIIEKLEFFKNEYVERHMKIYDEKQDIKIMNRKIEKLYKKINSIK